MHYRPFGRSGIKVFEIGLGGHREGVDTGDGVARTARFYDSAQDRARVVGAAIDGGVTYFDTTYGCELASLGESLRILGRRDGMFVSGMRVDFFANLLKDAATPRQYVRREVEGRLSDFGFDRLDQFLLGAMEGGDPLSHPRGIMDDCLDELGKLRREGKVGLVGFSCHSPDYAARLLEAFEFDSVMTPYNFANRAAEGKLTAALDKTGAAWIAMKPLVWHIYGVPVTALRNLRNVAGRLGFDPAAPIAQLAMRFILANPRISTIVPAMNSVAAVEENLAASGADGSATPALTPDDLRHLDQYAAAMKSLDMIPLGIAGLLEDNLRVRCCAIGHLCRALDIPNHQVDYAAADAPARCRDAAAVLLDTLRKDTRWAEIVP